LDDEKRKIYDETGEIDDKLDINIENTYMYFRHIYPTITKNDIDDFAAKYINSEMEKEDLIKFYNQNSGDIRDLLENIPLSTNDDISRYLKTFEELFRNKIIIKNKNFTNTRNKIKKLQEGNPEEVEEERKKLNDLHSVIQAKKRNRMDYLDVLSKILI
jgi:DnaJ family protein C protein 9